MDSEKEEEKVVEEKEEEEDDDDKVSELPMLRIIDVQRGVDYGEEEIY